MPRIIFGVQVLSELISERSMKLICELYSRVRTQFAQLFAEL